MDNQHELVGQIVIIVWALQYHNKGAEPETCRVLSLESGLMKLQKVSLPVESGDTIESGDVFWVPLTSISNIVLE